MKIEGLLLCVSLLFWRDAITLTQIGETVHEKATRIFELVTLVLKPNDGSPAELNLRFFDVLLGERIEEQVVVESCRVVGKTILCLSCCRLLC